MKQFFCATYLLLHASFAHAYDPFTHTQASEAAADASVLNEPAFLARLGLQAKPIRSDIYNAFYSSQANQLSILELIKFGADWEDTRRTSQGKRHFFN